AGAAAVVARTAADPAAEVARVGERYGRRFPAMWSLWQQRTRAADPPHDERPRGSRPAGGHPSSPAGGDPLLAWRELQLRQAVEHEMAVRLEDVLARRTSLLLFSADNGQRHVEALGQIMGQLLGWSPQRVTEEVALARQRVQEMFLWKEPSLAAQR